jgi:hypothetical protein
MQTQHSRNSTGEPDTPSVGALLMSSGARSDQFRRTWLESPFIDSTKGGEIKFVTKVDVTGQISIPAEETALLRLACIYIIVRLSGKALVDAYEALADLYTWQLDRLNTTPSLPSGRRIAVANVRKVERVPFVFQEE